MLVPGKVYVKFVLLLAPKIVLAVVAVDSSSFKPKSAILNDFAASETLGDEKPSVMSKPSFL
jgi:hypothetical protein